VACSWAGGAPNGGGNIDNKNTVTILEGLKVALSHADVVQMVGTGIGGGSPFWTVVQRHSFTTDAAFTPTAHPSPYTHVGVGGVDPVSKGVQGLKASYFAGTNFEGEPQLVRLDCAVNFHFFGLGPDPTRFRNGTFSVRWEGVITPDADVEGALLQMFLCHGHICGAPGDLGGRVFLDGELVVDAWSGKSNTTSTPINFVRGASRNIVVEYFQAAATGDEAVALQWSLIPSTVPGGNPDSSTTIAAAAKQVESAQ
jgi:hypothetical protein